LHGHDDAHDYNEVHEHAHVPSQLLGLGFRFLYCRSSAYNLARGPKWGPQNIDGPSQARSQSKGHACSDLKDLAWFYKAFELHQKAASNQCLWHQGLQKPAPP